MLQKIKTAEILCVGTEILIGDITNTNAVFISKKLALLGINQYYQAAVGDNAQRLTSSIKESLTRCDLLIITGGLGPTYDDLTKETAVGVLNKKLVLSEDSLDRIKRLFEARGKTMPESNIKQAMMPQGAVIFPNKNGTADGFAIEDEANDKMLILLPGPPRELEPMFADQVIPFLTKYTDQILVSRNINICGIGESEAEALIRERMIASVNPTEAPYCAEGEVRIRVTASAPTAKEGYALCDADIEEIRQTSVGKYIYGVDTTLEEAVVDRLKKAGKTLFAAESCTGGLLAKRITDIPGASAVLKGGVVSYTNDIKTNILGVTDAVIKQHTEVSAQCAAQMAEGARKISGADIGVSATGYASDGAGVPDGRAGLVYIGLSDKNGISVKELRIRGNRAHVRHIAVNNILMMMLEKV